LDKEKIAKKGLIKDKSKLEQSLSFAAELTISSLKVVGITKQLLTNKEIETDKASRIKKIRITFSVPSNPVATKNLYYISTILYSISSSVKFQKDTVLSYNGTECSLQYEAIRNDFYPGDHKIAVFINSKLCASVNYSKLTNTNR
jgi:hypothetical protein